MLSFPIIILVQLLYSQSACEDLFVYALQWVVVLQWTEVQPASSAQYILGSCSVSDLWRVFLCTWEVLGTRKWIGPGFVSGTSQLCQSCKAIVYLLKDSFVSRESPVADSSSSYHPTRNWSELWVSFLLSRTQYLVEFSSSKFLCILSHRMSFINVIIL